VAGSCEHSNGVSCFIKCREFRDYPCDLASQEGLCSMELATTICKLKS
jgi:hypothetical protein